MYFAFHQTSGLYDFVISRNDFHHTTSPAADFSDITLLPSEGKSNQSRTETAPAPCGFAHSKNGTRSGVSGLDQIFEVWSSL